MLVQYSYLSSACNWAGALIPWKLIQLPEGELAAPTNDINVTVALALLTSLLILLCRYLVKKE